MKMEINQRNTTIALFVITIVATISYGIGRILTQLHTEVVLPTFGTAALCTVLLILYLRGWNAATYGMLATYVIAIGFALYEPYLTTHPGLIIILPPILALVLARPRVIFVTALAMYVLLLYRAQWQGIYLTSNILQVYWMCVACLILARLITNTAQHHAEDHATQARQALIWSEKQASELSKANRRMNEQLEQQQRLLDLVETLETPMVALAHGVMLAPIVGHLSEDRAETLTKRLLQTVHERRTRLIVIDIAGVTTIDSTVALALTRMVRAIRLLGCEVAISGLSSAVATTLSGLGIDFEGVRTMRSPQEALQ